MSFAQNKTRAQVAGMLLAMWPPLMVTVGVMVGGVAFWILMERDTAIDDMWLKWSFFGFVALYMLSWALLLAQLIYLVFHILARNPRLGSNSLRAAWIVALLMAPCLVPFYWYLYLWKEPKPEPESIAQVFT